MKKKYSNRAKFYENPYLYQQNFWHLWSLYCSMIVKCLFPTIKIKLLLLKLQLFDYWWESNQFNMLHHCNTHHNHSFYLMCLLAHNFPNNVILPIMIPIIMVNSCQPWWHTARIRNQIAMQFQCKHVTINNWKHLSLKHNFNFNCSSLSISLIVCSVFILAVIVFTKNFSTSFC